MYETKTHRSELCICKAPFSESHSNLHSIWWSTQKRNVITAYSIPTNLVLNSNKYWIIALSVIVKTPCWINAEGDHFNVITFNITYLVCAALYLSSPRILWTHLTFLTRVNKCLVSNYLIMGKKYQLKKSCLYCHTRVGTLIVTTIYLQLIQNRYMFRSFTVLHCSHQHCVQPVASDLEVVGYL